LQTWKEMAADAAYELEDAHMSARELDGVLAPISVWVSGQGGYGAALSDALGISPIPVFACPRTAAAANRLY
jgi:hypothetical protein